MPYWWLCYDGLNFIYYLQFYANRYFQLLQLIHISITISLESPSDADKLLKGYNDLVKHHQCAVGNHDQYQAKLDIQNFCIKFIINHLSVLNKQQMFLLEDRAWEPFVHNRIKKDNILLLSSFILALAHVISAFLVDTSLNWLVSNGCSPQHKPIE